jgi:hypothetical protein
MMTSAVESVPADSVLFVIRARGSTLRRELRDDQSLCNRIALSSTKFPLLEEGQIDDR